MHARTISTTQPVADSRENLVSKIRGDINERTHNSIQGLDVSVADGSIIVTGRTSRYYYKQLTTRAVFDLISDLKLENRIEVDHDGQISTGGVRRAR